MQDTPLPGGIIPGKAAKKRRIKPVWVITACAVLVLLTGIAAGVVRLTRTDTPATPADADLPSTEDGSPSTAQRPTKSRARAEDTPPPAHGEAELMEGKERGWHRWSDKRMCRGLTFNRSQ